MLMFVTMLRQIRILLNAGNENELAFEPLRKIHCAIGSALDWLSYDK